MKQLFFSLIEKYHPFNIRYFKIIVVIIMTLLLGAVLFLGWLSSKKVKEVVTEDFNQQQLVLARHAASQIKNSLKMLERELTLLSLSPSVQLTTLPPQNRIEVAFQSVREKGGLEIRFVEDKTRRTYSMAGSQKCITQQPTAEDIHYLEWARNQRDRPRIRLTDISSEPYRNGPKKLIMKMLSPVWQASGDSSSSRPFSTFTGVLVLVIDVSHLIEPITREIRSGKTGYAWVIDDKGTFLYHVDEEFIGKNAFEARKGRTPTISFARINEIQKEKMLKGEEGMSWYISGWHRGIEGELKKLIAYSPIRLDGENRIWSVAVVAPTSEIEGAIHAILTQQFLLQGLIIVIILFGGVFINFIIISWSNMLEQEVAKKTIELRKSEQRYKSLVENAEDIIFTVDYHGNILSINTYGAKFLNRREEEIVGRNISENFAWPSAEVLLFNTQKVFETKESRQFTQMAVIGDRQYWFNTKLRRLWDEAGNVYAVLGIARDITALKEKEKEEQRYNIEKLASMGTLAAGVAHEINNPLAIILGFSDLLLEKAQPNTEQYDMLKTIEKQAFNAKRVVENLLRFARYTEDKEELVDVNESIEQILSIVKNTLFLNNISLQQELQDRLPKVKADPLELEQVFLNIINNAIHAMKGGGVLSIVTNLINGKIEIRFSDSGHGIKREHRSKIFDPLFTTKKVGDGTGLGLSVSYGIITKYGGTITFETKTADESPEPGTTFIITLPTCDEKH